MVVLLGAGDHDADDEGGLISSGLERDWGAAVPCESVRAEKESGVGFNGGDRIAADDAFAQERKRCAIRFGAVRVAEEKERCAQADFAVGECLGIGERIQRQGLESGLGRQRAA